MLLSTFVYKFVCERLFSVLLGIYPGVEFLGHFSSIQCRSVASDSLWPHGLQHARLPCPSPTPGACSNLCPSSRWCHPTVSSSVIPFSCLQSFPASGSFPMSQFFESGGQGIGASASASVLLLGEAHWLEPPTLARHHSNHVHELFYNRRSW